MEFCKRCSSKDRVQEHHTWCKFLDNPHGYSYAPGIVSRVDLCWDCHQVKLHDEIILDILNKYSTSQKKYKSQYHIWKNFILEEDKKKIIKEVVDATLKFIGDTDGNSI